MSLSIDNTDIGRSDAADVTLLWVDLQMRIENELAISNCLYFEMSMTLGPTDDDTKMQKKPKLQLTFSNAVNDLDMSKLLLCVNILQSDCDCDWDQYYAMIFSEKKQEPGQERPLPDSWCSVNTPA